MTALPQPNTFTVTEYLRVSFDSSGRQRSNEEQHAENAQLVDTTFGWSWADRPAYRDVGSASKHQRKRRDGYDELIADLAAGRFTADGLLLWVNSRGSRKVGEWVTLLELLEEQGKKVVVTTHGGRVYDPAVPRDRRTMLEDAIDAEYETAKMSQSIRRATQASAAEGKHHGGGRRAFGYTSDGRHLDEIEAGYIREAVRRVLGGESVRSIVKEWDARGIRTTGGNHFAPVTLSRVLGSARIAGRREHHGRIMEKKAEWPEIIDEVTQRRVIATIATRSPVGQRGRTPWLLTGLLYCSRCGASLVGNTDAATAKGPGTRRYTCRKGPGNHGCGGLTIKAEPVEDLLRDLAQERLADVEARRSADTGPDDTGELDELSSIAAKRIEIADDYAASRISRDTKNEDTAALDRLQRVVESRLAAKVRETGPLDFIRAEGLIGRKWDEIEVEEQRVKLDAVIAKVTVEPSSAPGSIHFDRTRITLPGLIEWKI